LAASVVCIAFNVSRTLALPAGKQTDNSNLNP